ncbi:hypothetical protein GQX74_015585 [Glossina fuscipes]|nr:hypothetical protein GQX74_015585 [Glossina fuscipes]
MRPRLIANSDALLDGRITNTLHETRTGEDDVFYDSYRKHFLFLLNPTAVQVTSITNKMISIAIPSNVATLYGLVIRISRIKDKTEPIIICLEKSIEVYHFGYIVRTSKLSIAMIHLMFCCHISCDSIIKVAFLRAKQKSLER